MHLHLKDLREDHWDRRCGSLAVVEVAPDAQRLDRRQQHLEHQFAMASEA